MDHILVSAIAFAYSQLILSVALLANGPVLTVQQRIYGLLLLAVAAHLCVPLLRDTTFAWIALSVAVAVPGMFWLFCCSLFDDHFSLRRWQLALVAFTVVFPFIGKVLHSLNIYVLDLLLLTLPQLVEFVLLGLALYVVARHWTSDLVESRRSLRLWLCGINGVYLFVLILFREVIFPSSVWFDSLQYASIGAMLLVTNVILLEYKTGVWINDVVSTQSSSKPRTVSVENLDEAPPEVDPALVARINGLMERDKVYREMGLTIGQLASRLDMPEYRLRRLINAGLGYRNFNDFLNQYRVKEASERLADPEQQNQQVLTIALDTGFRSLSSFNKAFKECYQITPSAFRRQHMQTEQ